MKSKLMRHKPEELNAMKFKEVKLILKKDMESLQAMGKEGTNFFVSTGFDYEDEKDTAFLAVGEVKGEWKKYIKLNVKPPHKGTAFGTAMMDAEGTTLTLNIEKGKGKPNEIEKALKKSKLISSSVTNIIFNETPKLDADDEIDAVDEDEDVESEGEETTAVEDVEFKKVVAEAKNYKAINPQDFKARLAKIKEIDNLIADWEKKNLPVSGNSQKTERNATLQKLRTQLYGHRIDINVQNRPGAEPIDKFVIKWANYKKRPVITGTEVLDDVEDRIDTVADLKEEVQGWYSRNLAPYSPKEKEIKVQLDKLAEEITAEENRLALELPNARKAHVKAMVEKLTKATPEQKTALKSDELFMLELSRVVPVAQINDARKLLGLDPVAEVKEGDGGPVKTAPESWNDPEIQELFKEFAKFTKFEVAVDHRANPSMKKQILLVANTQIWEDGKTSADKFPLGEDFTFELLEEDGAGNMKLKGGDDIFYATRTSKVVENTFKVLPKETALFPEVPSKNHVLQGGLGDCYLLAAVVSLVAKDPAAIVDMMLDKGDSVTVRLFDVKVDGAGKKTFTAQYINVDKSVPVLGKDDLYAKNYLWVQMLEKAYAAGNFTGTFADYATNTNPTGDYTKIEGGHAAFSFEVLTGKPGELLIYSTGSPKDFAVTGIPVTSRGNVSGNDLISTQSLPWGTDEMTILKAKKPNYAKSLAYGILGKSTSKTIEWATYVKSGAIDKLFEREYSGDYSGEPTIEDFELLFQGKMKDAKDDDVTGLPVLSSAIAQAMIAWLKKEGLYPGKRGSGVYSKLQLTLFKDMKDALTGGKLVGLGSKTLVGRSNEGTGHSGGEAISGGLVGGHAYSVLDTREPDPLKELEIRNPWGATVQRNVKVSDRIAEVELTLKSIVKKEADVFVEKAKAKKIEIEKLKLKFEAEKDQAKKVVIKNAHTEAVEAFKEIKESIDLLADENNLTTFEGNLIHNKDAYDKAIAEWNALQKKDAAEMISVQEEKLSGQDGGEFWLYLDDLTRRFSTINIG